MLVHIMDTMGDSEVIQVLAMATEAMVEDMAVAMVEDMEDITVDMVAMEAMQVMVATVIIPLSKIIHIVTSKVVEDTI